MKLPILLVIYNSGWIGFCLPHENNVEAVRGYETIVFLLDWVCILPFGEFSSLL